MGFRPLHDRVLVRRVEAEEKTAGGIIIPDSAKEKPQEGEVVAVGAGAKSEEGKVTPLDVKAGDKILFGKWSGTEVKIDGEDLIIMKESDILGIGAWLAFGRDWRGVGIWVGLASGLAAVAVLMLARWISRERLGLTRLAHG